MAKNKPKTKFDPKCELEKYGWTNGGGLGKEEDGITEAIKVKIKKDLTGVGHDPGKEFNFDWWDHVFNQAANNILVSTVDEEVCVKKEKDLEISTKKSTAKTTANRDALYTQFVKAETVMNEGAEREPRMSGNSSDSDDSDDLSSLSKLSDAQLLKACGGRTAHKGARHGLGLSGKLKRALEQEEQFCASIAANKSPRLNASRTKQEVQDVEVTHEGGGRVKRKKKKKRDKMTCYDVEAATSGDVDDTVKKVKKNKIESEKCELLDSAGVEITKSDLTNRTDFTHTNRTEFTHTTGCVTKKKKRKKKNKHESDR